MLKALNVEKSYVTEGGVVTALHALTLEVASGEMLAVVGPSGSGKTTLLGLLAGLDRPTRGTVELDGIDLGLLSEDARARLRRERVGFVFQSFRLLPSLTAEENVRVPLDLRGDRTAAERARELLARVGLAHRARHHPGQLSGGEQQRVALARAFVHEPRILFADEPTGNLDRRSGDFVIELMAELNAERGATVVLATHDVRLAARATRVLRLEDGRVEADERLDGRSGGTPIAEGRGPSSVALEPEAR